MSFSVSPSTAFANINWDSLEKRPPIDDSMQYCTKENWFDNVPCCMDGYTIEHVLELAEENGYDDGPESQFLSNYPCINGVEIDHFYEKFTGQKAPQRSQSCSGILSKIFHALTGLFS